MANTKRKSANGGWKILSLFLALVLVAGAVTGLVFWKKGNIEFHPVGQEEPAEGEQATDQGGAVITDGESNGLKLLSAKILSADYEANGISALAETAYALEATLSGDGAFDEYVTWTAAWEDGASSWASGKTVSDYVTVTPTEEGALTANVECLEAFGETVIITVTSRDNPEESATCRVDYAKKLTGVSLTLGRNPYTNFLKPETTTKELSGLVIDLNANVNAPSGYPTTVTVGGSSSVYTLDDDWTFTATMHEATAPLNGTINGKAHRSVMGFGEGEDIIGTAIDFDYDWLNAHSFHISETSVAGSGSAGYYLYNTAGQTMLSYCNALTDGYLCAITVTATGEYSSFEWTINVKCTWKYTTSVTGASLSEDQIVF